MEMKTKIKGLIQKYSYAGAEERLIQLAEKAIEWNVIAGTTSYQVQIQIVNEERNEYIQAPIGTEDECKEAADFFFTAVWLVQLASSEHQERTAMQTLQSAIEAVSNNHDRGLQWLQATIESNFTKFIPVKSLTQKQAHLEASATQQRYEGRYSKVNASKSDCGRFYILSSGGKVVKPINFYRDALEFMRK